MKFYIAFTIMSKKSARITHIIIYFPGVVKFIIKLLRFILKMSERVLRSRTIQLQTTTASGKRKRAKSVEIERDEIVRPAKRCRRAISTITKSSANKMSELGQKVAASSNKSTQLRVAPRLQKNAGKICHFFQFLSYIEQSRK